MYADYDIREISLALDFNRRRVETFLKENGLRLDEVETYIGVYNSDDELVGGGGLHNDIIKCVAVRPEERGSGLMARIVSRLQSIAEVAGYHTTMVFTKPENLALFRDLGYVLIGQAPKAILLESSTQRLNRFKDSLQALCNPEGDTGIIVMNANPFTRGHQYLIETASRKVAHLVVMVVSEEKSDFLFSERIAMVREGTKHIPNVVVIESGPYAISAATFPTYFLKELSDAAETQMMLDADIFSRHIAPALGANVRFVGTEPDDFMTRRYNEILKSTFNTIEIERLKGISASLVRKGHWEMAAPTSLPYVYSYYACKALIAELNLTPKPGLVDCHDSGVHKDMDYALMRRRIFALRPYFREIAEADDDIVALKEIGIRAEAAMLDATGGVNTHKGALFSLGLTIAAAASFKGKRFLRKELQGRIMQLARKFPDAQATHGAVVRLRYPSTKSALENAREGFTLAFEACDAPTEHAALLYIVARLDDTNILYRRGAEVLMEVKDKAAQMLKEGFDEKDLMALNDEYIRRNISPGGAADMYALSVLIRLIVN